jgi:hypothetical protein
MARTNPRPKLYASAAERQAAYRERFATIEVRLDPATVDTLSQIAQTLDVPRAAVIEQVIKHGLLNRDWFRLGLRSDLRSKVSMQGARVTPKTRAAPKV